MATEEELINSLRTDWGPTDFYSFTDLNRVEEVTVIVKNKIETLRNIVINLDSPNTTRTEISITFADSLNRIENNINTLMQNFSESTELVEPNLNWKYDDPFDFNDANRYESNLLYMYEASQANLTNVPYCGQYTLTTVQGAL